MITKAQIKLFRSLQVKKHRNEEGLFIAEGKKTVKELLHSYIKVELVYATPSVMAGFKNAIEISEQELSKISALAAPQGIVALCRIPQHNSLPDFKKELVLALDDIRDPGNMGTIIRTADWFGIAHIFCSHECVDAYNPKVVQASMGSIARVKVHYTQLSETLEKYKKESIPVYGALLKGKSIYEEKLAANGILVIGNEANGISQEVKEYITHPISIPSYVKGKGTESLNAAVAAAVLCAEFRRKK